MGLSGLEPPTSRLSGVRSNRLSYKPLLLSFGNTIASLRYARCTFSLRFKLRFARFHQVFLWKHHCSASLRKVCLFSNLRLRFRSSSLRKQCSGIHLLSHTVSSIVPSADRVLTIVFGMRTGVSPGRIDTAKF